MASPLLKEIQAAAKENKAKMKWPKAETIAQKFTVAVLVQWAGFEERLLAWMPGDVKLDDVRKTPIHAHAGGCGCELCNTKLKTLNEADITRLRSQMASWFTSDEIREFEGLWEDVLKEMFDGNGRVVTTDGVFNKWYKDVYQEGLDQAYRDGKAAVQLADPNTRSWFKKYVAEIYPFDESSRYVQAIYSQGFTQIRSAITVQFKAEAMEELVNGLTNQKSWLDIASNIHTRVGIGSPGHWKRLVRTEMLKSFDRSSKERYTGMRATFVKMILTPGACKKCRSVYGSHGYFRLAAAPSLPESTHPNCRCRYLPKWNLPKGILV